MAGIFGARSSKKKFFNRRKKLEFFQFPFQRCFDRQLIETLTTRIRISLFSVSISSLCDKLVPIEQMSSGKYPNIRLQALYSFALLSYGITSIAVYKLHSYSTLLNCYLIFVQQMQLVILLGTCLQDQIRSQELSFTSVTKKPVVVGFSSAICLVFNSPENSEKIVSLMKNICCK